MDRVLVIVYSFTGTGRRLAQLLASHQGWPIGEVREAQPRSAGGWGYLRCGLDSLLRRHPRVRYEGPDPAGFDTVVLIAPIWLARLAGPMRSFVAQHRGELRRVAAICTMGSSGAADAFREIGQLLGRAPVACAAFMQNEVDDGACTDRLLDFGRTVAVAPEAPGMVPAAELRAGA